VFVVLFCLAAWIGVQRLRYVEFDVIRRMLMGGEFRRILESRIRTQLFDDSLAQARTPHECWLVIRDACREFGFSQVTFLVADVRYHERFPEREAEEIWNFRVSLSETGYVDICTPFRSKAQPNIVPFVQALQGRMRSKGFEMAGHGGAPQASGLLDASGAGA
jgi:hypothetical protein